MWANGDAYELYVGRWSRLVARDFLRWIGAGAGLRWLDVGCGTGALSAAILAQCDPAELVGVDQSEAHVAWTAAHIHDERARFVVADAAQLPAVTVDVVVSGLVLNFLPDAGAALAAMRERGPAGTVAAYVWDYAGRMDLMRHFWDAAGSLDPSAARDEAVRFPICHPDRLRALWEGAGLTEVAVGAIDVPTVFRDFDDYWAPFLGGQGVAPAYAMSLDVGSGPPCRWPRTARSGSPPGLWRSAAAPVRTRKATRPRWVAGPRCAFGWCASRVCQTVTFFSVLATAGSGAAKALLLGVTRAWMKPAIESSVSRITPR